MENSKFDKFIRENAKKELETPNALSWENMNIPLPEKKKRRRPFFWMWLLAGFLLLISSVGIYYNWNAVAPLPERSIIATTNTVSKSEQAKTKTNKTDKEEQLTQSSKIINTVSESTTESASKSNTQTRELGKRASTATNTSTESINSSSKDQVNETKFSIENANNSLETKIVRSEIIASTTTGKKTTESTNENLPLLLEATGNKKINFAFPPLSSILETLNSPKKAKIKEHVYAKPTKFKKNKFFPIVVVSLGVNYTRKNYSLGNQLAAVKEAEGQEMGESYSMTLRHPMKNNFFLSTGLTYERLHNSFTYRETLSPIINTSAREIINRVKRIHHNNFFEYVELNIGAGRRFYLGGKWSADVLLHLNPSYQLKLTGRTLNEESAVVYIEDFSTNNKLFWSASSGLNLRYMFRNYNLFIGAKFKQSLQDIQLLNNSNLQFNHQAYSLNMGMISRF